MAYTLKGKLDEIVTNVGALDSEVISTYASTLTEFVDGSVQTSISTIENTTNNIETSVSTVTNTIDAISTEISTVSDNLSTVSDTTNDINTNVSTIENTIDAISTTISTEFASINSDLSSIISTIATLS